MAFSMFRRPPGASPPVTPRPGSPSNKELEETIGILLLNANVPKEHTAGIASKLRGVLVEAGHRPYSELVARSTHPCVLEYLTEAFKLLNSQIRSRDAGLSQFKPGPDRDLFKQELDKQVDVYYTSIAETLGRGFEVVLKPNLKFDASGNPIGVRDKDVTRFPGCNARLSGTGGRKRKTRKVVRKSKKTKRRLRR